MLNKKQFKEIYCNVSYDEYKNSIPEVADVFSISSYSNALNGGYYNFKIETKKQKGYFGMYHSCMGHSNEFWDFLEELCDDNFKFKDLFLDLEGYGPVLIAEDVKNGNIRLTIINGKREEFYYDKDLDIVYSEKVNFPDGNNHIQLDIIVNKRIFIYHFYLELLYVFDKNVYKGRLDEFVLHSYSNIKAKTGSEKIAKYLGFVKANDLDIKLYHLLGNIEYGVSYNDINFGTIEEIEKCLIEGANPNAIITNSCNEEETIFNDFLFNYTRGLFFNRLHKETNYDNLKQSSRIEQVKEKFKQEHLTEIKETHLKILNLLLKHDAKTYLDIYFHLGYMDKELGIDELSRKIINELFKNNCKITSKSRKEILLEDRSLIDLFDKYKCLSSYRWID